MRMNFQCLRFPPCAQSNIVDYFRFFVFCLRFDPNWMPSNNNWVRRQSIVNHLQVLYPAQHQSTGCRDFGKLCLRIARCIRWFTRCHMCVWCIYDLCVCSMWLMFIYYYLLSIETDIHLRDCTRSIAFAPATYQFSKNYFRRRIYNSQVLSVEWCFVCIRPEIRGAFHLHHIIIINDSNVQVNAIAHAHECCTGQRNDRTTNKKPVHNINNIDDDDDDMYESSTMHTLHMNIWCKLKATTKTMTITIVRRLRRLWRRRWDHWNPFFFSLLFSRFTDCIVCCLCLYVCWLLIVSATWHRFQFTLNVQLNRYYFSLPLRGVCAYDELASQEWRR